MEINEEKVSKVVNEIGLATFCYNKPKLPNSFYDLLNDKEKAEVIKRIKGGG